VKETFTGRIIGIAVEIINANPQDLQIEMTVRLA